MTDHIEKKLLELLNGALGLEVCDPIIRESSLSDDHGLDSLDLVELVMAVEETFDIEITDEEGDKMDTMGDLIDTVAKHYRG